MNVTMLSTGIQNEATSEHLMSEDFVPIFKSSTPIPDYPTNHTLAVNMANMTNGDGNTFVHAEYYDLHILVIVCILCGAAIIGNSLLITVLYIIPSKKTHLLIANLAIGDLGEALMFLIDEIMYPWTGNYPCVTMVTAAIFRMFDGVSILSLFALAISQTMAICRPLHYPSMVTRTKVWTTVLLIWLASLVLPLIGILVPLSDSDWVYCPWSHLAYDITEWIFLAVLIVEVAVIIILYVITFLQVQTYKYRQTELTQGMSMAQNRKAFLTTMIVLSTLVITWLPFLMYRLFVWNIMMNYNPGSVTKMHTEVYLNFIVFLPVINTISDPIIYGARMPDVQRGLSRLFKFCQRNRGIRRNEMTTSFSTATSHTNVEMSTANKSRRNEHPANNIKLNTGPVNVNGHS